MKHFPRREQRAFWNQRSIRYWGEELQQSSKAVCTNSQDMTKAQGGCLWKFLSNCPYSDHGSLEFLQIIVLNHVYI